MPQSVNFKRLSFISPENVADIPYLL